MSKFNRRQNGNIFLTFFPENKLSHFMQIVLEIIFMKWQNLFSEKKKRNVFKMSSAEFLLSIPHVKPQDNLFVC